jgi:hypothetical protein
VTTDPRELEAVLESPHWNGNHELRSVLSPCTGFRKFVALFADIAMPLCQVKRDKRLSSGLKKLEVYTIPPSPNVVFHIA